MIHFSPATGGFYHACLHVEIPADAVPVTDARHRRLLAAQATGRTIVAGEGGRPVLATIVEPHVGQLRAWTAAAIKREATRRIRAVASIEQRLEDVTTIALSEAGIAPASDEVLGEVVVRYLRIRAVRAAAAELGSAIEALTRDQLAAYDAATDPRWPEWNA